MRGSRRALGAISPNHQRQRRNECIRFPASQLQSVGPAAGRRDISLMLTAAGSPVFSQSSPNSGPALQAIADLPVSLANKSICGSKKSYQNCRTGPLEEIPRGPFGIEPCATACNLSQRLAGRLSGRLRALRQALPRRGGLHLASEEPGYPEITSRGPRAGS